MLDGGFDVDVEHIVRTIAEAEVVCLCFPLLRTTLIVDTRTAESVVPLVRLVPIAASTGERLSSLRRLRSGLPRPDSITTILWTRRVDAVRRLGVWECLLDRLVATGDGSALERAEACLGELGVLEKRELRRALTGEQHRTLWGRPGIGDADGGGTSDNVIP